MGGISVVVEDIFTFKVAEVFVVVTSYGYLVEGILVVTKAFLVVVERISGDLVVS